MEIISVCRANHLNFDDYLTYSKTLTKKIRKERKNNNEHTTQLLLIEKNVALGLMHQHRHLKLKKLKKAYKIGFKLKLTNLESVYFHCVAGIFFTYSKDYSNAHRRLSHAMLFFNSVHYKSLNESLIEMFEQYKDICITSLKQISYQLQLQNIRPEQVQDDDDFMLESGQSICQIGSKSFCCGMKETFSLYTSVEEDSHASSSEVDEIVALAKIIKTGLKHNNMEKQYITFWIYLQELACDLSTNVPLDDILAGKSVYRALRRLDFIQEECPDLISDNLQVIEFLKNLKSQLESIHKEVSDGNYRNTSFHFNKLNSVNGLPRLPNLTPNTIFFDQVEVL